MAEGPETDRSTALGQRAIGLGETGAVGSSGPASEERIPTPPSVVQHGADSPLPDGGPDYEIGEELSRGGMGRVLAAVDRRLGRTVALKQLLLQDPAPRARFEREALITARLQHPSIVPVYEAGQLPSGEPFYAMKLVSGRTLRDLIGERSGLRDRLALLPHVLAMADAVAFAHGQGVIHRDLKPGNVVVGEFGETVVIDWGLAKDLRAGGADPAAEGLTPTPDRTTWGTVIGTPAYMAPEQARGAEVDARADVWALGATLYHLLAGRPPYEGPGSDAVLEAVRGRQPDPIALFEPAVPEELAALVDKAMARDPRERYPSARELAEDLRRFQTGQLVGAYRYSAGTLARRWARRHRAVLSVSAAAALVLALAGAVAVRRVVQERDRAEAGHRASEELVQFMLGDLRERLRPVGRLDALEGVGERVERYYEQVAPDTADPSDPSVPNRAEALATIARVRQDRGQLPQALEGLEQSAALHRRHAAAAPEDFARQRALIEAEKRLGDAQRVAGRLDKALAAFQAALAAAEAQQARAPGDAAREGLVSMALQRVGDVERLKGDLPAALGHMQGSLAIERTLAARSPGDASQQRYVQVASERVGEVLEATGRLEPALAAYQEGLAIAERVRAQEPADVELQWNVAASLNHVAGAQAALGHLAEASEAFDRSLRLLEELAQRDPTNGTWLAAVVEQRGYLGGVAARLGRPEEALRHLRAAVEEARRLAASAPRQAQWQSALAQALTQLGGLLSARPEPAAALAPFSEGLAVQRRLCQASPGDESCRAAEVLERTLTALRERLRSAGARRGGSSAIAEGQ